MARTMYDSVTAKDIPAHATMVAGYIDGKFRWSQADWARFPHATKVRIAVSPHTDDGHVLDVEPGDSTPAQAQAWIRTRHAAGLSRPTIYCNRSTWPAVRAACKGLTYAVWIAEWTGHQHGIEGAAACQWATPGHGSPGHYDISLVTDDRWPREVEESASSCSAPGSKLTIDVAGPSNDSEARKGFGAQGF